MQMIPEYIDITKEIGACIAQFRERAGLSREAVSASTGVPVEDIGFMERGEPENRWKDMVTVLDACAPEKNSGVCAFAAFFAKNVENEDSKMVLANMVNYGYLQEIPPEYRSRLIESIGRHVSLQNVVNEFNNGSLECRSFSDPSVRYSLSADDGQEESYVLTYYLDMDTLSGIMAGEITESTAAILERLLNAVYEVTGTEGGILPFEYYGFTTYDRIASSSVESRTAHDAKTKKRIARGPRRKKGEKLDNGWSTPTVLKLLDNYRGFGRSRKLGLREIAKAADRQYSWAQGIECGSKKDATVGDIARFCDAVSPENGMLGFLKYAADEVKKGRVSLDAEDMKILGVYADSVIYTVPDMYKSRVRALLSRYGLSETDLLKSGLSAGNIRYILAENRSEATYNDMLGILTAAYVKEGKKKAMELAEKELRSINLPPFSFEENSSAPDGSETDVISGRSETETAEKVHGAETDGLNRITKILGNILLQDPEYGNSGVHMIADNFEKDPGLAFALAKTDITALVGRSASVKQEFLNRVKSLVEEFSRTEEKPVIERYL